MEEKLLNRKYGGKLNLLTMKKKMSEELLRKN